MTPDDFDKVAEQWWFDWYNGDGPADLKVGDWLIAPEDTAHLTTLMRRVFDAGVAEGIRRAALAVAESKTEKLPASLSYASAREAWGCDEPGRRRP